MSKEFINTDPTDEVLNSPESAFQLEPLERHYERTHLEQRVGGVAVIAAQVETGMDG